MSDMDTVCKQRFDKLPLMIENKQNNSWKEVWKSKEESMTMDDKCAAENGNANAAEDQSNVVNRAEVVQFSDLVLECNHIRPVDKVTRIDVPSNEIMLDVDHNESGACNKEDDANNDSCIKDVPDSSNISESACPPDNQADNLVKVCGVSSCSYFGKPDPLVPIAKVDHGSSFECYEIGTTYAKVGSTDIILETDLNVLEDSAGEIHDASDIEVEYTKGTLKQNFNVKYFHESRESRFNSSCKKNDSCDVVQISSSDDDDDDDADDEDENDIDEEEDGNDDDDGDDELVHSHFVHAREEQPKKPLHPVNYVCSLITMEVPELNISAMKAGPISCFPDQGCIFFKDFNNHSNQDVTRETFIHAHSLESHHWIPMFGGSVLEITLNLTGCHENVMTFFQVPLIKIAGYCLRFPTVALKMYFEARVANLTLKHNFQQFLDVSSLGKNGLWHSTEKDQEDHAYLGDMYQAKHGLLHTLRPLRKLKAKRMHPYKTKVARSNRASSKFSYYKPPRWPYLKKIDYCAKKKEDSFRKNSSCSASFPKHIHMSVSHWSLPPHSSQNYYRTQNYYNHSKTDGTEFMGRAGINMLNPMNQIQQNPNMGIMLTGQTGHWFERMQQEQSPVYLTSGFQGTTTKLFTYKPPNSKGGINVTNEDLFCLNDGEYLNDVIIDFYLKYLMEELISNYDKQRTHVFSSFFYGHLISGNSHESLSNLSPEEQRHAKVKTWTRHVDIFSKDFIIVPINESYHWFLAIICFPNMKGITKYRHMPLKTTSPVHLVKNAIHEPDVQEINKLEDSKDQDDLMSREISMLVEADSTKGIPLPVEDSKLDATEEISSVEPDQTSVTLPIKETKSFELLMEDSDNHKKLNEVVSGVPDETSINEDMENNAEENDEMDDILMDINSEEDEAEIASESSPVMLNLNGCDSSFPLECKDVKDNPDSRNESSPGETLDGESNSRNPCILIFDSLKGESRYDVVNILRQYLQVEWNLKKRDMEGEWVFDKSTMKGSMVTCPQQPNSSDCGIYVLQFVESFFKDPVKDFTLPLALSDWFTSRVAMSKRYQLAKLIMKLKKELNPSFEYDPTADGCFNIAPIVSDDDDDVAAEEVIDEKTDKNDETFELSIDDEKSMVEESDCKTSNVNEDVDSSSHEVVATSVEDCDIVLDNLCTRPDAELFSLEEQNKLNV